MSEEYICQTVIKNEPSGIYQGILLEDMTVTVAKEKKFYCKVRIPDVFGERDDCPFPLTYVPLWAMSLPLRKGDRVLVRFNQDNFLYPVLYKNESELTDFNSTFDASGVGLGVDDIVSATRLGDDSYLLKTNKYTIIRQQNSFILLDGDNVYTYGSNVNIKGTSISIESQSPVTIKGTNQSLFKVLNDLLTRFNNGAVQTSGGPIIPAQFVDIQLMLSSVLGE